MELVSVVMPVKINAGNINPAIESILKQTYENIELLIVGIVNKNDINIDSFKNKRIKYLEHDGNISMALNTGISAAKGKYIMRMDSDDYCSPNKTGVQLNALLSQEADVVGCNVNYVNESGDILLKKIFPENDMDIKFYMPINVTVPHPTMLTYRNILIKAGQYNESLSKVEDLDLFLRMINRGVKFYNVQEFLYSYRIKKELWDVESETNLFSYKVGSDFINTLLSCDSGKNYIDNLLRKALLEYYKGDMNVARRYFKKYLVLKPKMRTDIMRYLIISLFPGNGMKVLRKYKIPQKINFFIHKIFKKDLQYQIKR